MFAEGPVGEDLLAQFKGSDSTRASVPQPPDQSKSPSPDGAMAAAQSTGAGNSSPNECTPFQRPVTPQARPVTPQPGSGLQLTASEPSDLTSQVERPGKESGLTMRARAHKAAVQVAAVNPGGSAEYVDAFGPRKELPRTPNKSSRHL